MESFARRVILYHVAPSARSGFFGTVDKGRTDWQGGNEAKAQEYLTKWAKESKENGGSARRLDKDLKK